MVIPFGAAVAMYQKKSDLCVPGNETARPRSQFLHSCMNEEIERKNTIIRFWKNETDQFHFWEYINWNQTFILNSHQLFICSVCTIHIE